jgi:hypothetical protein
MVPLQGSQAAVVAQGHDPVADGELAPGHLGTLIAERPGGAQAGPGAGVQVVHVRTAQGVHHGFLAPLA